MDRSAQLVAWLVRHRTLVLMLLVPSLLLAGTRTFGLYAGLRSELEELLPVSSPAVAAVHTLRARIPGSQHLGVVVRGPPGAPAEFVSALASRCAKYKPGLVRMVRTDVAEERRFLRDHAPLYMSLPDLREVRSRVERYLDNRIGDELDLSLADEERPALDFSDIEARYPDVDPWKGRFQDHDRLVSNDGRMALLLIFVGTTDTGTSSIGPLFSRVRADVAALEPERRGLEVGYAGDVAINVEELAALQSDLLVSTVLVVVAVVGVLLYFYRWWGAIPALGIPLMAGVLWGFGLASLRVAALNTSTAFLGSIVIGNGINPGIMLLARYAEERRGGAGVKDALIQAVRGTWRGTLTATLAAIAAYGALTATSFRGFHQFGVIGSLGMATCWIATYLILPPVVSLLDRRVWQSPATRPRLAERVGSFVSQRPRAIVAVGLAFVTAGVVGASRIDASRIEYDMSKLRCRNTDVRGEAYWSRQMDDLLGRNFTAIALMAEHAAAAPRLVASLQEEVQREPLKRAASAVLGPEDLVPLEQVAKLAELAAMRKRLTHRVLSEVPPDQRKRVDELLSAADHGQVTASALPEMLAQGMRERDGTFGRTVLMVQSLHGATWDGLLTLRASEVLRKIAATVSPPAQLAGGFIVTSEILAVLKSEALPTTGLAFALVVLVVLISSRRVVNAALGLAALVSGVVIMAGMMVLLRERVNFLSFIAFPITFGIGVDYAANLLARYEAEPEHKERLIGGTGGAVALCSATTIIGYASLLLAQNRALFSFGVLAVLGELACVGVAVLVLPAALQILFERVRARLG